MNMYDWDRVVTDMVENPEEPLYDDYPVSKEDSIKENYPVRLNLLLCPECGSLLFLKKGKYGEFVGCSGFPKCNFSMSIHRYTEFLCGFATDGNIRKIKDELITQERLLSRFCIKISKKQ